MNWLDKFWASRPLLDRVVGRIVRPDEIEDIVQETFVHTYAASRHQKIHNPRAFILKTAKNIALNYVNRSERKLSGSLEDLLDIDVMPVGNSLESQCEADEKFLLFCRAVSQLPVSCRRTFILKKVYGQSQKEIAKYLGISTSTVEKHIAKGMVTISLYMDKNGYSVTAEKPGKSIKNCTNMERNT